MQQANRHTCSEVVTGGGIDSPGLLEGDALAEGSLTGCCWCMAAST